MELYFDDVIGQEPVKNRLNFILNGFKRTSVMSHLLFSGGKGVGKSHLARLTAKGLHTIRKQNGSKKPLIEVNGTTLQKVSSFVEQVLIPYQDKEVTVFIDELHAISDKVAMFLLSVLNPNQNNRNLVSFDEMELDVDFRRMSFITATTETQMLFEPLRDRLTEIALVDYTTGDLSKIIARNVHDVTCEDGSLNELATFCKSNARSATKMGGEVETYCGAVDKKEFKVIDVKPLVKILDLFPLGLNRLEVGILQSIADGKENSLKMLCSKSGLTRMAQQDTEKMLLKFGLMRIDGKRVITKEGKNYLDKLNNW